MKAIIEKQNLIRQRNGTHIQNAQRNYLYSTQNNFDFGAEMKYGSTKVSPKAGQTALLKDNPSNAHMNQINQYIK